MNKIYIIFIVGVIFSSLSLSLTTDCRAGNREQTQEHSVDLTTLTLEELMNIQITSVSKKPERLIDAASAIYVITQEDIRRSGVTNIPEVLRMVPGIQVARIDANKWAISARGLTGRFANKLLVLLDGRTVYTSLFSGVFWDVQDTLLEDIDRIEVIRGPGATLWGANAVNGVINIITKHTKDTQGGLLIAGYGDEERGFGGLRYGGKVGDDFYFRVYAKYFNRDDTVFTSGRDADDNWDVLRGGFRTDWKVSNQDSLTLQGDIYDGESGQTITVDTPTPPFIRTFDDEAEIAGGNVLGRWKHTFSEVSDMAFQLYFDRTEREDPVIGDNRNTFDVDFQHRFALGKKQDMVWGLGYRFTHDDIKNTFSISFDPESHDYHLFSAFVQDEITLLKDWLRLTVGSKFEYNDFTGLEIQPSARLLWKPHEQHSVWTAFSRAVRTPSRAENDVRVNQRVLFPSLLSPFLPFDLVSAFGSSDFESEKLYAYELGYRVIPLEDLAVDIALFYNDYDKLRTAEPRSPFLETIPEPSHLVFPLIGDNKMDGEIYGVELAVDWRPVDWWHITASYTYLQIQLHLDKDSGDIVSEVAEGESPHNQFFLRSSFDLPKDLEIDLMPRYTDNLPSQDVDSYVTLDARLSWKPFQNLEISVVGQNLFDNQHLEFKQELIVNTISTEVERSVYGKIEWRF